ncbi:MAG: winged helix-turn-helix transcriptional regulator [Candidatus Magasanikbacteria bacterium]|nr:winged helix-turn-helix transcriptional regulator [Candidatus Magasanikbacteria bacterium]
MLEHFFGSKTRLRLLKIFFRSPEQAFYVRELSRLTDTQLNAVRREIANLEKMGLIAGVPFTEISTHEAVGTGRSKYYRLDSNSLLYPELKALLLKAEIGEERHLVEMLKNKAGQVKLLLLTGIFLQEKEVDTDILIVGKIKPLTVAKLIKAYENELGKVVRYTILDEKEFRDRREIGDKFLYSLFEAKHLSVVDEYHLN